MGLARSAAYIYAVCIRFPLFHVCERRYFHDEAQSFGCRVGLRAAADYVCVADPGLCREAGDTTGWTLGEGSTITGNADYGWSLNQAGCNQDRQAKFQNKYETDISLRDLQMQFVANYAAAGLWTINLSDKDMNPLPGVNDLGETGLCLILEKRNDSVLAVQRWSNGAPRGCWRRLSLCE